MPMQYPSRPEMKVEIAFVDNPLGNDPEDDAQISLGGGVGLPTGWTDISAYTREVSIDRGRSADLERVESGTASVILDNRDRRFDPVYEAGPYWDNGSSVARRNLLRNPNFEYGVGNWVSTNPITPTTGSWFRRGKGAQVQCVNGDTYIFAPNYSTFAGTTTSRTPVTAGVDYTFAMWMMLTTSSSFVEACFNWYDAAGNLLLSDIGFGKGVGSGTNYRRRLNYTSTAPVGAVSVVPFIKCNATTTAQFAILDYALLEESSSVNRFFDGNDTGAYWEGTPGDSTSVLTDSAINLIPDPSSEATVVGATPTYWTDAYDETVCSDERSLVGSQSLKTTPSTSNGFIYSSPMPFAAGEQLNFSCFIYTSYPSGGSPNEVQVIFEYYDDNGLAWDSDTSALIPLQNNAWTKVDFQPPERSSNNTASASYSKMGVVLQYTFVASTGPTYLDAATLYYGYVPQPYFDGDMSGYEWTGERSGSASQALVRSAGTLLKPRRQIQVHAVFPNDVLVDQFCYDLVDGGTLAPGDLDCQFTRSGLMQDGINSSDYSSSSLAFTTTEIDVCAQIKPYQRGDWYYMDTAVWRFNDRIALGIYNGKLEVWVKYSASWSKEWEASFPTTMRFGTPDSQWIKVNVIRQPFGAPGNFRYRIKVYGAIGQMPVPQIWDQIGTEVVTASSSLTPALTGGTMQIGGEVAVGSLPRADTLNNRFQILRLAVDDKITSQRTCDIMFDTHHTLFRGFTRGWRQQYAMTGKDATVPLECFDMLGVVGSMTMPADFVTEWARQRGVWGYWKLGDAGGVAVDYSGNGNDLYYNDGGRLPSTYGPLASGLSGLPTEFKQSLAGGGPALSGYMISNTTGAKYPVSTALTGKNYSVSFWMRTTTPPGTINYKVPLFLLTDSSYWTGLGLDATSRQFLEMGYINSVTGTRQGLPYVQYTRLGPNNTIQMFGDTWSKPGPLFQYVDNGDPHFMTAVVRQVSGGSSTLSMYMDGRLLMIATAYTPGNGGTIVIGGRPDTTTNLYQYAGDIQDVMYFPDYALSDAEVEELYTLSSGIINENTGQRMERLMDFAGVPEYLRAVDPDVYGDCGLVSLEEGKSILEAMHQIEDTEAGIVFADREGRLALRGRYFLSMNDLGVTSQADFDDANVGIGYQNLEFNLDADQLANDHTVIDDSEQENEAEDELSVAEYGRRSRTVNTLLRSSEDAYQMAIGLTNIYKNPLLRAEPFDITPTGEQWLKVMPLDIGVRMTLEATPMGIGDPIVQELALQKISYSLKPKDWRVQITGSPRPVVSYFVLDKSVLDGEDVLGF